MLESGTGRKTREAAEPDTGRHWSELNLQKGKTELRRDQLAEWQSPRSFGGQPPREGGREVTEKTNSLQWCSAGRFDSGLDRCLLIVKTAAVDGGIELPLLPPTRYSMPGFGFAFSASQLSRLWTGRSTLPSCSSCFLWARAVLLSIWAVAVDLKARCTHMFNSWLAFRSRRRAFADALGQMSLLGTEPSRKVRICVVCVFHMPETLRFVGLCSSWSSMMLWGWYDFGASGVWWFSAICCLGLDGVRGRVDWSRPCEIHASVRAADKRRAAGSRLRSAVAVDDQRGSREALG